MSGKERGKRAYFQGSTSLDPTINIRTRRDDQHGQANVARESDVEAGRTLHLVLAPLVARLLDPDGRE
jgi:hypothetical protein